MTQEAFDELLAAIDPQRLPRHIAVIMDGNGRWAARRGLPRSLGHQAGVEAMRSLVEICHDVGVSCLTVYAFSTENWKRSQPEVEFLMGLIAGQLRREAAAMDRQNISVACIGRREGLSRSVLAAMDDSVALTAHNTGMRFNLAINYGGRDELVRAVRALLAAGLPPQAVDEAAIAARLDTAGQPDPDLLIRPAGEERLSNFLLWQSAYSELWFTDKLWPDFSKQDLLQAITDYQRRERRFGGRQPEGKHER